MSWITPRELFGGEFEILQGEEIRNFIREKSSNRVAGVIMSVVGMMLKAGCTFFPVFRLRFHLFSYCFLQPQALAGAGTGWKACTHPLALRLPLLSDGFVLSFNSRMSHHDSVCFPL